MDGKYHGYGRYIDVYAFCYEGQFQNGLRHGKGKGTDHLGIVKEGEYVRNIYQRPGEKREAQDASA